jgi:hypothetical protein
MAAPAAGLQLRSADAEAAPLCCSDGLVVGRNSFQTAVSASGFGICVSRKHMRISQARAADGRSVRTTASCLGNNPAFLQVHAAAPPPPPAG